MIRLNRKYILHIVFLLLLSSQLFACQKRNSRNEWHFKRQRTISAVDVSFLDRSGVVQWAEIMTYGDEKVTNYVAIDELLIEWGDYDDFLSDMSDEMREVYVEDMISLGELDPGLLVIEVDRWLMSASLTAASLFSIRDENIGYLLKDVFHEYELDDPVYAKKVFSFTNGDYSSIRSQKSFGSSGQDTYFSYDVYRADNFVARVRFYGNCRKHLLIEQEILELHNFVWDSLAGAFSYSLKMAPRQ